MTTLQLIAELEKRAGYDEVSRTALGFIQKTIGVCNSLPNGQMVLQSIENPDYFVDYNGTFSRCICQCSESGMWHDQGCPMRK